MKTKKFIILIGALLLLGVTLIYSAVIPSINIPEKEFTVLPNVASIKVGKIVNGNYIPGAILPASGGVSINLLAIPDPSNASWPATARWYYKRTNDSDDNYAEIGSLSNTSYNFTSGGSWTIKAKCGSSEKMATVFIIDSINIIKEVDTVIKCINTKLGIIEVKGNNELMPNFLKDYVNLKITAPKLSRNNYDLIINNGIAEITFTSEEILPSDGLNNAVIDAVLSGIGNIETASNTFTSVVINSINLISTKKTFKINENVSFSVDLLPSAATTVISIQEKINNLITSCMKIIDVKNNRNVGTMKIIGNTAGFVTGPDGTRTVGDAELSVIKDSDLWNGSGSNIREFNKNLTIAKAAFKNLPKEAITKWLTVDWTNHNYLVEIDPIIATVSVTAETNNYIDFISYNSEDGTVTLKSKKDGAIGPDGIIDAEFDILATYDDVISEPGKSKFNCDMSAKFGVLAGNFSDSAEDSYLAFKTGVILGNAIALQEGLDQEQIQSTVYGTLQTQIVGDKSIIKGGVEAISRVTVNKITSDIDRSTDAKMKATISWLSAFMGTSTPVYILGLDADKSMIGRRSGSVSTVALSFIAGTNTITERYKGLFNFGFKYKWNFYSGPVMSEIPNVPLGPGGSFSTETEGIVEANWEFNF